MTTEEMKSFIKDWMKGSIENYVNSNNMAEAALAQHFLDELSICFEEDEMKEEDKNVTSLE